MRRGPRAAGGPGGVPELRRRQTAEGPALQHLQIPREQIVRRRRRPGLVQRADVPCPACGGPTQQNPAEREHGRFWCPNCGRYPDDLSRIEGDSDPVEPRSPSGQTSGRG